MRPSLHPGSGPGSSSTTTPAAQNRARQYAHLHAQLAQLNAHLADTQNLVRMTAVQAEYVRGLGGWMGGLFMASSKILGDETVAETAPAEEAARAAARARQGATAAGPDRERGEDGGQRPQGGDEADGE